MFMASGNKITINTKFYVSYEYDFALTYDSSSLKEKQINENNSMEIAGSYLCFFEFKKNSCIFQDDANNKNLPKINMWLHTYKRLVKGV